jgi:hypothetical protein
MTTRVDWEALAKRFIDGLPPYVRMQEGCEIRNCSAGYMYTLLGAGRVRAKKDGPKLLIDTLSLLDDMASLPEARITPTKRERAKRAKLGKVVDKREAAAAGV